MDMSFLRSAVKDAFSSMRHKQVDQDLEMYNKLKPSDFMKLVERYGPDNVAGYIREMELRRTNADKTH